MNTFREISKKLPPAVSEEIRQLPDAFLSEVEELRLRQGKNIRLKYRSSEKIIPHIITSEDLKHTLNNLINFSYYAYEQDLANGFVTIEGGHRVGVCGKAVIKNGKPALIKEISSLNIRFAKEVKGCADSLIHEVLNESGRPVNTLIVSPPGCGKTTLIRDLARNISNRKLQAAICDERSEIAGMYCGRSSFDLGSRTDVLDGCDKTDGIPMLIRSMSPDVIFTDESGKKEDIRAVEQCLSSGVALITSIHGSCREEIEASAVGELVKKNIFQTIIYLSKEKGPGTVKEVTHA